MRHEDYAPLPGIPMMVVITLSVSLAAGFVGYICALLIDTLWLLVTGGAW